MFHVANDGAEIADTDYWQTPHSAKGLCYLSGNAGVWRLLVPPASESMLAEMRTGRSVTIEPSIQVAGCLDVVFEDGSDAPFALAVDLKQTDRVMHSGECRVTVWTVAGKQLDLPAQVRL